VTIREVVDAVFVNTSHPCSIVARPITAGSVKRRCPDISKVRALGYEPRVMLTEGVRRTFEWYRSHHLQTSNSLI
jgi:UDP-glucose 4-epimerase